MGKKEKEGTKVLLLIRRQTNSAHLSEINQNEHVVVL